MSKAKERPTIDSLLADRARFEAWLDQLAAKADQVPGHVVSRVRADYEARLTQVVETLVSRAGELRSESEGYSARIAELDAELGRLRDARAEDELRALVGEYTDTEWSVKRAAHDDGIGTLAAEREAREADLNRVVELLSQATRPSRAIAAVSIADIPEEPTAVEPPVAPAEPEPPPSAPPAPRPSHMTTPVGLFESFSDTPTQPAPAVRTTPPPPPVIRPGGEPAAADRPKTPSPFDEIAFLKTVVGRATPLGVPRTPPSAMPATDGPAAGAAPRRSSIPSFEPPPLGETPPPPAPARPTPAPRAAPTAQATPPESVIATPEPTPPFRPAMSPSGDAARSLKCQECGWMNYPTEWYCEKCGGELAAF